MVFIYILYFFDSCFLSGANAFDSSLQYDQQTMQRIGMGIVCLFLVHIHFYLFFALSLSPQSVFFGFSQY